MIKLTQKNNIIISAIFAVLFVISFFLPVLQFSFDIRLNGFEAFGLNFMRLFITETYTDYLLVMTTVITPILCIVLIIWSFRNQINIIAHSILSTFIMLGICFWIYKFGGKGVLLFGYYYWLILTTFLIAFVYLKQKQE